MTELIAALEAAAVRLHNLEGAQSAQWANLWLALGRATQAVSVGNHADARRWLKAAEAHERELTKSGVLGVVLASLEALEHGYWTENTPVVQPSSTRYSSQPPPASAETSHIVRRRGRSS
jgi:hypothetical protein